MIGLSRRFALVAALIVLGLALAACGGDDGDDGGAAQDPADLVGPSWILTQYIAENGDTEIVEVGVNASFDGSAISGISGCNTYNASYEATGGEISFGPIALTQMACPELEMSVEARYLQLLETVATFEVEGRSMSMADGEGTPILQFMQG